MFVYTKNRLKTLVFISIIFFAFYLIEKHVNSNSKLYYFEKTEEKFLKYFDYNLNTSLKALHELEKWTKNTSKFFNKQLNENARDNLCVFVLSKQRYGKRFYPVQTLISLIIHLQKKHEDKVAINIINLNNNLNKTDLILIESIVEIISIQHDQHIYLNKKIQESIDYSTILKYIYQNRTECKYVMLLEDDAIAAPNWYISLMNVFKDLDNDWFCLKLFTSYKWLDWLKHIQTVFNATLLSIILFFILRPILRLVVHKLVLLDLAILFISSVSIVILWKSLSIAPLGYGIIRFTQGFNTVANVYQRKYLKIIYEYLSYTVDEHLRNQKITFSAKDIALGNLIRKLGLQEFIIEPCLFQHIGLHSSLDSYNDEYIKNEISKVHNVLRYQYGPFQSYSFIKEFGENTIEFNSSYFF